VKAHGTVMVKYIPTHTDQIFKEYIVPMDKETTEAITSVIKRIHGTSTLSVDGVTILSKSHLLYTISKGEISLFLKSSQLGSLVHTKPAEVLDAARTMEFCRETLMSPVTNLAVDNAAKDVMAEASVYYAQKNPKQPPIIRPRDPAHCIDLVAKDSAKVSCFALLLGEAEEIIDFMKTDRVDGILSELWYTGKLEKFSKVTTFSDTRFNKAVSLFECVLAQKPFLLIVRELLTFSNYYNSRTTQRKNKIDKQINLATPGFYQKLKVAIEWFKVIEYASKLVSGNNFPMSAYLAVVQAMRNGFNVIITNEGGPSFDSVMGTGSQNELAAFF
jgi:hypothetical protein